MEFHLNTASNISTTANLASIGVSLVSPRQKELLGESK